MTAKDLKNALLQEAVQGRLVPQLASEGNAADLLKQIRAEKARLIKEGKIKKEKPLPEITDGEIPFDIPESWCWCRLGEIVSILGDGIHGTPEYDYNGSYYFVNGNNLVNGKIEIKPDTKKVNEAEYLKYKKVLTSSTVFVSINGTLGNLAFYNDEKIILGKSACYFNLIKQEMKYFVYNLLQTKYFLDYAEFEATKTTIRNVSLGAMKNLPIPLPPLAEQKRIVAAIERFMPLIEEYGKKEEELRQLNASIGEQAKKALLQEAVQGRLVPQMASDGNAADLLKQIQAEKAQLIKEGKLKKEKPLPPITDDEIPFDIPESWCWCRLGELGMYRKGPFGSSLTKSMFVPKGPKSVKVYEQKNAIQKDCSLGDYYISYEKFQTMQSFIVEPNDIIVSCAGTIGEVYKLPFDAPIGIINQALMRVQLYEDSLSSFWIIYFDYFLKREASKQGSGTAIKNIPPFEILKNYPFPLPPLSEQKRIVSALEQLLPLCEKLGK